MIQTELDDTKSYYQLIIKITISEKKKNSKVMKKGEISHTDKGVVNISKVKGKNAKATARARTRNYNFECDWLI